MRASPEGITREHARVSKVTTKAKVRATKVDLHCCMSIRIHGKPLTVLCSLGLEFITVKVGVKELDGRTFGIHKDLVCAKSPFFRAAFNGQWKESKEGAVELPEDDPDAFELWVNWIYKHTLPCSDDQPGVPRYPKLMIQLVTMTKAYTLGDKIGDTDFADAVMDAITHTVTEDEGMLDRIIETMEFVYKITPESSPLREFLVELYVFRGFPAWFTYDKSGLSPEFVLDTLIKVSKPHKNGRRITASLSVKNCDYHHHKKVGRPCYTTLAA